MWLAKPERLEVHIAGSGNYRGGDLKAENASVDIAGSGDASYLPITTLKASVAGSGNVTYRGNPTWIQRILPVAVRLTKNSKFAFLDSVLKLFIAS